MSEPQIYRIDHYLGKETVRNIMVARFANPMIEAVWNSRYVDHVQITAAESIGVGRRGKFYDQPAPCATWCPTICSSCWRWSAWSRPTASPRARSATEKNKVVDAIRKLSPGEVSKNVVRGRYGAGRVGSEPRKAYSDEASCRSGEPD